MLARKKYQETIVLFAFSEELAPKHIETKFCKINAEKCPFLTERLR